MIEASEGGYFPTPLLTRKSASCRPWVLDKAPSTRRRIALLALPPSQTAAPITITTEGAEFI